MSYIFLKPRFIYSNICSQLKAVEPGDFFTAIDTVSPGDAKVSEDFFAAWTLTKGFPLVTASLKNKTLTVTQKRFMQTDGTNHSKTERYNIPITYTIDSKNYDDTTPKFVFRIGDGNSKSFEIATIPEKYYILNTKQTGFYRVNYDEENWNNIKEALIKENHDSIHVMNRAQIVDDLFNLARGGVVKYETAIGIIRYIQTEKHYIPWLSAINNGLTFLSQRVSGDENQETFAWFIQDLVKDIYDHLKFFEPSSSDRRTDIYNRVNILTWACKFGHAECISKSQDLFDEFVKDNAKKVNKELRSVVYCNAVRNGNSTRFDFLYNRFMNEDIAAEQLNLLIGMSCTKDESLVKVTFHHGFYFDLIQKFILCSYF